MHRAAQEICVFQMGANQDPRGLTLYFYLHSGLLSEYQFFILTLPHASILNEGGDTAIMFISLHIPLNHIWHHWLLSCPGSPDRYPSASVQATLCSLAFRTQQGFVNASLLGAQKHTDKCFKASSTAPDSHDTQKYPARQRKVGGI